MSIGTNTVSAPTLGEVARLQFIVVEIHEIQEVHLSSVWSSLDPLLPPRFRQRYVVSKSTTAGVVVPTIL